MRFFSSQPVARQYLVLFFFFQAEDGIRDLYVTGVQTCALPISRTHGPKTPAATGPPLFGGALGGLRIGRRDRLTTNAKRGTGQLPVSHHGRPVPVDNGRPAGTGPEYVAPRPATCSSDAGHAASRGSSAERASQARGGTDHDY